MGLTRQETRQAKERLEDEAKAAVRLMAASIAFDHNNPSSGDAVYKNSDRIAYAVLSRLRKHYRITERAKR